MPDLNTVIANERAVQSFDGRAIGRSVRQVSITKCRGHPGLKIANNPDGNNPDAVGFDPFSKLAVRTIVGNVREEKFRRHSNLLIPSWKMNHQIYDDCENPRSAARSFAAERTALAAIPLNLKPESADTDITNILKNRGAIS